MSASRPGAVDPLTAELIVQGLSAIPNLVDRNITRTAYSVLISEYKDYAVGIVDAEGRLVTQCRGGLPIFVANALCAAVKDGLRIYGRRRLQHGDVVISNHAGTMGQHLNNVVMYTPIRTSADDDGLVGFMAIVAHWIDIGGMTVGSSSSNTATEIYQEGLQLRTVKLLSGGERVEEMFRVIEYNSRFPRMLLGDIESQIAGCLAGRDMVRALVDRHGRDAVLAAIEGFWAKCEASVREAIRAIPDGVYRASAFLDDDGLHPGRPVPVAAEVRVEGDEIVIDLSGTADQMQGPLNAGFEGGAVAAARIACKYLFSPDEPANEGAFRPIRVVCRPGTFLSAQPPVAMGASGSAIPTVVDTILRALADAVPERVPAAHHGTYAIHMIYGARPDGGGWFQHLEATVGGWGAAADRDGTGPFRSMAHGDTLEVPVELQEASYPYTVEYVRLREDSGGAGRQRGGLGVEKAYRLHAPCRVWVQIERTRCPPWGLDGGHAASTGRVEIHRPGKEPEVVLKGDVALAPRDRVRVLTAGGGGFGDPCTRTIEAVVEDVRAGYVSRDAARDVYGVVIDEQGRPDLQATGELRSRIAAARGTTAAQEAP